MKQSYFSLTKMPHMLGIVNQAFKNHPARDSKARTNLPKASKASNKIISSCIEDHRQDLLIAVCNRKVSRSYFY